MELAQREIVAGHRLTERVAIGQDVGGFQQLVMAEPADGAALLIGAEHALAEAPLVKALPDDRGHVLPPRGQRAGVVDLPGGRCADWSSIATMKVRVSGWSSWFRATLVVSSTVSRVRTRIAEPCDEYLAPTPTRGAPSRFCCSE